MKKTLFLFCAVSCGFSQGGLPVRSEGEFRFYLDTAGFRSSVGTTFQEFYYQIPIDQLTFTEIDSQLVDTLSIEFVLEDSTGSRVYGDSWNTPIVSDLDRDLSGRFVPEQLDLLLKPGPYTAQLELWEHGGDRRGKAVLDFTAVSFRGGELSLSSIQLATEMHADSGASRFSKNGIFLLPNPSRRYGHSLSMVIFYYEIYNLSENSDKTTFNIQYDILDAGGEMVRHLPQKSKKRFGESSADVGAISVAALQDSVYVFGVKVTDTATGATAERYTTFFNVPLTVPLVEVGTVGDLIAGYSSEQLEEHIRKARYIMSNEELDVVKNLDEQEQRTALVQFWKLRDPSPETPENEFWMDYMSRVEIADQLYSNAFEPGWLTDRGRILIKFGKPDEIETYPLSIDSKPYEVWFYYREKGFQFIFMDEEGFNNYRLIYSTDKNEISESNWRELINYR
jgi:GWxTD domain-containing protein